MSRFGLMLLLLLTMLQQAAGMTLKLHCVIGKSSSESFTDPIIGIDVSVDGDQWSVVHKARSGATYDRANQYDGALSLANKSAFAWRGRALRQPNKIMIGQAHLLRPGTWSYEENVFDQRRGNRHIASMLALCAIGDDSAANQAVAVPVAQRRSGKPLHEWNAKAGEKMFEIDGLTITLSSVPNGDSDPYPRLVARGLGIPTLVLEDKESTANYDVQFDAFAIDPAHSKKDILMSGFSGGAHCCAHMQVASLIDGTWKIVDFGAEDGDGQTARPVDVNGDGIVDFQFGDNRFLYTFGAYSESAQPSRFLKIVDGTLVDESSDSTFAPVYRREAAKFRADCGLGQNGSCAAYVAAASRFGDLLPAFGYAMQHYNHRATWDIPTCFDTNTGCDTKQTTTDFAKALPIFLKQTGYRR